MTDLIVRHLALWGIGVGALLLVALGLRLIARRDAVLRYRLMVAALFCGVLLLPVQALTSEFAPRPNGRLVLPVLRPAAAASERATGARDDSPRAEVMSVRPLSADVGEGSLAPGAMRESALVALYLAGVLVAAGMYGIRANAARRLLRGTRPVTDPDVLRVWRRLVEGSRCPPEVLECDRLHAPACRALGRRAVILPAAAGNSREYALEAVIRHELIHLGRRDGAIALVAAALTAVLWFQPVVWVFACVLRVDREHSCDVLVVRATRRPRSYALALLRFCDPAGSVGPAVPIIGFESAHSIRRRITMLAHALQPAARPRQALVLGAGSACLLCASAAHALLTAAAGPGPVLGQAGSAAASGPSSATHGNVEAARMTVEIPAAAEGRSDTDVYRRLVDRGVIAPNALAERNPIWALPAHDDKSVGVNSPRPWVTDQETILAANTRTQGETLHADRVRFRLPDGSKLRAVFEGREVKLETGGSGEGAVVVKGGGVRIVDEDGVTRVQVRADSNRGGEVLRLTRVTEPGAAAFEFSAADGSAPVTVRFDTHTGVPEKDPEAPHGVVRWNMTSPRNDPGRSELRMQWIYDLGTLQPDGC